MPFKKGKPKTGGRTKGCKNKITQDLVGLLNSMNCNPIEALARIAEDENNPIEIRTKCHAELAQYLHPKRRAVELSGPSGGPVEFSVNPVESLLSRVSKLAPLAGTPGSSGGNAA